MGQKGLTGGGQSTMTVPGHSARPPSQGLRALHPPLPLPDGVVADLRTDHAGETGAVSIYRGVLFFARDAAVRRFARQHLATEQLHLRCMEGWLAPEQHSRLLPLWRAAGWLTGALPALAGPRSVYATVAAVERFVDLHYAEQILRLRDQPALQALRRDLEACQADEIAHLDDALAAQGTGQPGLLLQAWTWLVSVGSRSAVAVCRHI